MTITHLRNASRVEGVVDISGILLHLRSLEGRGLELKAVSNNRTVVNENRLAYTPACATIAHVVGWTETELTEEELIFLAIGCGYLEICHLNYRVVRD